MRFKFEGHQQLWITANGHPVTVLGRSEFFNDRQPRYYIRSDTHIPGKNVNEDWINEDQLTHIEPMAEPVEPVRKNSNLRKRPGIRKTGI